MFNISNVTVSKTTESNYIKPLSIDFTQNGVKRRWDLIQTHSSVSILIYNTTRNVLIFVKQFRPAVWYNSIPFNDRKSPIDTEKYPSSLGVTLELCAGIIDKDKPIEEIAREEVLEECGYDVPLENLKQIKKYRGAVGFAGEQQTLFYAEVTDDMKVAGGGGVAEEGEFIEVVEISTSETKRLLEGGGFENSPPEFLFALMWMFQDIFHNV